MRPTPNERLRIYMGRTFHATDAHVADENPKVLRAPTGDITTIKPYWHNGAWAFDDPVRGCWAKPFLDQSPEMVDRMLRLAQLPPRQSFVLTFADRDWPGVGYRFVLDWVRENSAGHWYRWNGAEGLYPALLLYFDAPPKHILPRHRANDFVFNSPTVSPSYRFPDYPDTERDVGGAA